MRTGLIRTPVVWTVPILVILLSAMALTMPFSTASPVSAAPGLGVAVAPDFPPGPFEVGDSDIPAGVEITNTSTGDVGTITVDQILLTAQCGEDTTFPCTVPDPGVFAVSPSGTGSNGGCDGISFSIAEVDATTGRVMMTPDAPVNIPLGETCRIDFTVDVVGLPTVDGDPNVAGVQTYQLANVTAQGGGENGSAFGTDTVTFQVIVPPPPPVGGPVTFLSVGSSPSPSALGMVGIFGGAVGLLVILVASVRYAGRRVWQRTQ